MIFSNEMPLVRKHKSMDDYGVDTWASVKAAGEQSLMETPTNSAWRMQELIRANMGKGEIQYQKYSYNLGKQVPVFQTEGKLPRSDAEKQVKDSQLPLVIPEEGYTQTALNIVMDRKKEELRRKAQIDATSGVIAGTAKFTMALGAQILDPTNVALAFVPIVAPAKYAAMLKAATSPGARAGLRAKVGAAEGLAGAAIAEPIIYMAMQKEQADYTMSESLLNVGLGTVFGAGLHAGAGAVGDAIKKGKSVNVATKTAQPIGDTPKKVATAAPETREAMLKTSVSQEARGIQTDVEAIGANDPNLNKTADPVVEQEDIGDGFIDDQEFDLFGDPVVKQQITNLEVVEAPINEITLSRDVPQFKEGADQKGVVDPLGGKFERTGVAPIQIWVRNDGRKEVISGRHRLDLAARSGEETIPAQYHYEKDGFGADQAAVLDAMLNIREGQGKVKDYVDFIKATKLSKEDADAQGILARQTGKRAYSIATKGSDALISSHRNGKITDEAAVRIAEAAPNDEALQSVGIKAIQEGKTIAVAENMVKAVKSMTNETQRETGDLFGFDDSAMIEAENLAKAAVRKQSEIQKTLSAVQGAAKRPDLAAKEGVNIKDPKAVNARIKELQDQKREWQNWHTNPRLLQELKGVANQEAPPLTANPAKSLEATVENQVMRGDDPEASIRAQETIDSKELDVDEELQMLTEQTANLETLTGAKMENMLEYDNAIKKAESDAIALEAAVTCRIMK